MGIAAGLVVPTAIREQKRKPLEVNNLHSYVHPASVIAFRFLP